MDEATSALDLSTEKKIVSDFDARGMLGYLFEGIDFVAKAKQTRISQFEEETDGYSLLNLSGNWMTSFLDKDLNIFWSIDNVFDTEYYDHLSRLKESGIAGLGRNISIGLKYNF